MPFRLQPRSAVAFAAPQASANATALEHYVAGPVKSFAELTAGPSMRCRAGIARNTLFVVVHAVAARLTRKIRVMCALRHRG
jgi:hypothetical protein